MSEEASSVRHRGNNNTMSSSTQAPREDEPLLGAPGDATQPKEEPLYKNLILGTAPVAQLGILILFGIVWGSVFSKPLMLFSAHPLLNSAGLLLVSEAILIVQPTHTPTQKVRGTYAHSALNNLGIFSLIAGLVVILYNKISHNGAHFESPHAVLGLTTYIVFFLQAVVGATAFFIPKMYGSVSRAKSLYKYHRASGYLVLLLSFVTVAAATFTDFNKMVLDIKLWAVITAAVITLVGIVPRIKLSKFGL